MKKLPFSILASLLGLALLQTQALKAQITITQADMPVAGDYFAVANDSNPALLPAPYGANVSWNYSSLTITTTDSLHAVPPAATLFSGSFPTASFGIHNSLLPGLEYSFFTSSSSSLLLNGYVDTSNITNVATPYVYRGAETFLSFPAMYTSSWRGGFTSTVKPYRVRVAPFFDSLREAIREQYHDTIESWGMCLTPYGNDSTIRDLQTHHETDSLWGHDSISGLWVNIRDTVTVDTTFIWLAHSLGYPMLSMQMRHGSVFVASWLEAPITTGINKVADNAGTLVYPNPASSLLNVQLAKCTNGDVKIIDVTGRQISAVSFSNKLARINTTAMSSGVYFFQVYDKSGNLVDTGKFVVNK